MNVITPQNKIKDLIIILAMIAMMVFISQLAKAQVDDQIISYVASQGPEIADYPNISVFTKRVMIAFINDGEKGLDLCLKKYSNSWYAGVDLYLSQDPDDIYEAMQEDEYATYKKKDITNATISIVSTESHTLVMVYSFR
jgi:hypothetical protein